MLVRKLIDFMKPSIPSIVVVVKVLSDVTYHIDHCDLVSNNLRNPYMIACRGASIDQDLTDRKWYIRVRRSVFIASSVSVIKLVGGHVYKT